MQRKYLVPSLLVLAVASVPALADEIVYFTNGTSMPVQSYSIEDGTIRLDLGDQAYVAFPVEQIDRIETVDGQVRKADSSSANRMVGGVSTGAVPSRHRRQPGSNSATRRSTAGAPVETHKGVAISRPYWDSPSRAKRQLATVVSGNAAAQSGSGTAENGPVGASRLGSRYTVETAQTRRQAGPRHLALKVGHPNSGNQDQDNNDENE